MAEVPSRWKARLRASIVAAVIPLVVFSTAAQALPLGLPALPAAPILPNLPRTLQDTTRSVRGTLDDAASVVRDTVGRPQAVRAFEKDINGARVVRGEVLVLSPTDQGLATAQSLGFTILRQQALPSLGLSQAVLGAPDGMSVTDALAALRKADPSGSYDYNHIYDPSGGSESWPQASQPEGGSVEGVARIGMIDAGVDRRHPALRDAEIETKTFAGEGKAPPTAHGTAIASLLVGQDGDFHGALRGTTLYAADVYGGAANGGSSDAIARALAWLAGKDVAVVNISLAGPPNMLLAAAAKAFVNRGHILVAAVGNEGPAAPMLFPAGYPGVVGVTSVDANRAIQIDANRGADVAFAAHGVDVRAAGLKGRYESVTGTSFAAPVVAARFAMLMARTADPARAWLVLEHTAIDLGPPGRDPVFGYGYLDPPSQDMTSMR